MEIHVNVILEVDDAELDSRGGSAARAAAPAAAQSAVQKALEANLGDARVVFVSADEVAP